MAATDAKRTIEVILKISGVTPKAFTAITDGFKLIEESIKKTVQSLDTLKTKFDSIKVPDGIDKVVTSLKSISSISKSKGLQDTVQQLKVLSEIKRFPNVKGLVQGFEGFAKIKAPPDLTKFAAELLKFKDIKVPNIKQIAQGLERLTASSLNMGDAGKRLRILYRNLKRFSDINVPNILNIAKGLENLVKVSNTTVKTKTLDSLIISLQRLNGIKLPNLVNLIKGLKDLGKINLGRAETEITRLATALRKFSGTKLPGISALVNGLKKLIALDLQAVIAKIKLLNDALKALDKRGHLKSFATFARDLNTLSAAMNKMQGISAKTKKAFESVGEGARRGAEGVRGFTERLQNYMQYRAIADVVFLLKDAFVQSITIISEYSQALKDLEAITGASTSEIERMGVTIREVASTTKFSVSEVAEGMRTLGQAGLSAEESIGTMQAVSDLATGTLSSMATTVDLVTTAMRVFQIDASESATISDVFANAVNRSKLTIDKLRTSMNYVGPIAKSAGVSFQDMSAAMMTLANSGLRASTIGTGLRRVFAELLDPSEKLISAAKRVGISLSDLNPRTKGLKEVIGNLGIVLDDAQVAFDIFGKRGAAAALALSDTDGQFSSMLETVSKSGTAAKMASIQMEGLAVSFKNLKDKLGLFAVAIGKLGIADAMHLIVNATRKVIDVLTSLAENSMVQFIAKNALVIGAAYALVKAFNAATIAIKAFAMAQALASTTALVTTLKAIPVAVAGIAAATPITAALFAAFAAGTIIVSGIIALLGSAKREMENYVKSAEDLSKSSKSLENYRKKLITMKEGSSELEDASLAMREELLKTADGMSDIAIYAEAAADSINPLTGAFENGTAALEEYGEKLNEFTLKDLKAATSASFDNLDSQVGVFSRTLNGVKTAAKATTSLVSNLFKGAIAGLDADSSTQALPVWTKAWEDFYKKATIGNDAKKFSLQIEQGKASFEDLSKYIEGLNYSERMNSQNQAIIKSFQSMNETVTPLFAHLRKIGKIDTSYTVENMEELLKSFNFSDDVLSGILYKFEELKKVELEGVSNEIERWALHADDSSKSVDEMITLAKEAGRELNEVEIQRLKISQAASNAYKEEKKNLVVKLNDLKKETDEKVNASKTDDDRNKAYEEHLKRLQVLLKEADALRRKYAGSGTTEESDALNQAAEKYETDLKLLKDNLKSGTDVFVKEQLKIATEFAKSVDRITGVTIDPKEVYATAKAEVDALSAGYEALLHQLEMAKARGTGDEKDIIAQKAKLEREWALEKEEIWITAENKIIKETGPDSSIARKASKDRRDAESKAGDISIKNAKRIAEEKVKAQEAVYELADAKRETANALLLSGIADAEAEGTISHEEAEAAKLQISLDYYDKSYQNAKKRLSQVNETTDPDEYQQRLEVLLQAEEKYYNERSKKAEKYSKKIKSLNEKIDDKTDDYSDEITSHNRKLEDIDEKSRKKREDINYTFRKNLTEADKDYATKVNDIEEDLVDKIVDINKDLADKLDDIDQDRVERKNELKADLLGVEESTEDKIRKLHQRGLSDERIETDNKRAAYQKLAEAKRLMYEADKTGNSNLADQAKQQISDAESLGASLENTSDALRLVRQAGDYEKENLLVKDRIATLQEEKKVREEIRDAQIKVAEAKEEHTTKLNQAKIEHDDKISKLEEVKTKALSDMTYAHDKALSNESIRFNDRINNLQSELDVLNEQLRVTKLLAGVIKADRLGDEEAATESTSTSKTDSILSKKEIEDVKSTAKATIEKIREMGVQSQKTSSDVKKSFAKSMKEVFKSVDDTSNGFEEFIIVTDASGKKVVTTAKTIQQGFNAVGTSMLNASDDIKMTYDEAGRLKELISDNIKLEVDTTDVLSEIEKNIPEDIAVNLQVQDTLNGVNSYIDKIQTRIESIGDVGKGIKIIGPEQEQEINRLSDSLSMLFSGLDTDEPKQKLQDMITVMRGLGPMNTDLFNSMARQILEYSRTVDGVGVRLESSFINGERALLGTSKVIDATGKKYKGLITDVQSNPFKLFEDDANAGIAEGIQNIEGAVKHLHDRAEKEAQIKVSGEQAKREMEDAIVKFNELENEIEQNVISPTIIPDVQEVSNVVNEENRKIEESEPAKMPVVVDKPMLEQSAIEARTTIDNVNNEEVSVPITLESITTKIDDLKNKISLLSQSEISIKVQIDNSELETLVKEMQFIADQYSDLYINTKIGSLSEAYDLLDWLKDVEAHSTPNVNVDVSVNNIEGITRLRDAIFELVAEPLIVAIDNFDALDSVRELADNLSSLVDKYHNKIIKLTVQTTYTSSGSKPVTKAFYGGLIKGFNKGGDVFNKLLSPFISTGSGTKDDVPAMLTKGEYVHKQSAVQKYGLKFMEMINNLTFPKNLIPRFSIGGSVGSEIDGIVNTSSSVSPSVQLLKFAFENGSMTDSVPFNNTDASLIIDQFKKMGRLSSK